VSLLALLRKEALWVRHNPVAVVLVVLVVPTALAGATLAFQTVLPRDAPVGVVPAEDDVTSDDLALVEGGVTVFGEPRRYDSRAAASDALRREEVYVVVETPHLTDPDRRRANLTLSVLGSNVPYRQSSAAMAGVLEASLDRALPAEVTVERRVVGTQRGLSAYLLAVLLVVLVALYALVYLPYALALDRSALDRLRLESSLEAVVGAKLLFYGTLLVVPVGAFAAVATVLDYAVTPATVGTVLALGLGFLHLGALAAAVMVLTDFSSLGRLVNVTVLFGLLGFAGLFYPVGFFSPVRRELARRVPLHHVGVLVRSETLTDVPLTLFLDRLLVLAAVAVGSLLVLELAIRRYERRR
jgi:ABC-2 type transport system permease protein